MATFRNAGLFLLLSFLWGTAFVAISAGLDYLPPVLFAAFRYDLAGAIMIAYAALWTDSWWPESRADWGAVAVGSVLVIALYNAFLFVGQQSVTSGVAAILIATNPILATAFSRLFLADERLSPLGKVGLVVGFVGVGLVVAPDPSNLSDADVVASGFVLLAAACVALGSVLLQRGDSRISTEATVAWSCVLGAAILHAISFGLPGEAFARTGVATGSVLAVSYLAVCASAVGYFIYFRLLDRLGAIEINLVSYATPPFAAVFGWLLLGEAIAPRTLAGFLVISGGFVLIKREAFAARLGGLR